MDTPNKKPNDKTARTKKTTKPKENKVKKEGTPRKKANRYRKIWTVEKEDAEHLKGLVYTLQKLKKNTDPKNRYTVAQQQQRLAHLLLKHRMLKEDNPLFLGGDISTPEEAALPPSPDSANEFLNLLDDN